MTLYKTHPPTIMIGQQNDTLKTHPSAIIIGQQNDTV